MLYFRHPYDCFRTSYFSRPPDFSRAPDLILVDLEPAPLSPYHSATDFFVYYGRSRCLYPCLPLLTRFRQLVSLWHVIVAPLTFFVRPKLFNGMNFVGWLSTGLFLLHIFEAAGNMYSFLEASLHAKNNQPELDLR